MFAAKTVKIHDCQNVLCEISSGYKGKTVGIFCACDERHVALHRGQKSLVFSYTRGKPVGFLANSWGLTYTT